MTFGKMVSISILAVSKLSLKVTILYIYIILHLIFNLYLGGSLFSLGL